MKYEIRIAKKNTSLSIARKLPVATTIETNARTRKLENELIAAARAAGGQRNMDAAFVNEVGQSYVRVLWL